MHFDNELARAVLTDHNKLVIVVAVPETGMVTGNPVEIVEGLENVYAIVSQESILSRIADSHPSKSPEDLKFSVIESALQIARRYMGLSEFTELKAPRPE